MAAGTAVGPVRCAAPSRVRSMIQLTRWAATGPESPTGQLRKTGLGPAVRLFVCIDRRLQLRGHDDQGTSRRVNQGRDLRAAEADRAGFLRPHRRPGPAGTGGRRVHHQGARRRGVRRAQPGGQRQAGMKRSSMVEGYGIPLGRVLAPANRHDPRCWPPHWTSSATSVRGLATSRSTSMSAMTRRKPATSSPAAG